MNFAEAVLDQVVPDLEANPPPGLTANDVRGFVRRNKLVLLSLIDQHLGWLAAPAVDLGAPETWTTKQRTEANLAALRLLASSPSQITPADRAVLRGYSGWGGLSIERVRSQIPAAFPPPAKAGLVHEYYTPLKVWRAVADVLDRQALSQGAPHVRALEPSAGIGRALAAFEDAGWSMAWTAVEASALSAGLLRAVYPSAQVHEGFFEGWVAENADQRFDLVTSNPPYGPRGAAMEQDPDAEFRYKQAYLYFVRRTLGLLRPMGIGVYLIPTGLMGSRTSHFRKAREAILRRHHLLAAFRLPSQAPEGQPASAAVYDQFVTDLVFWQARGGLLPEVLADDTAVLEGAYFDRHPDHVLGTPMGLDEGWEPGQPKPRRGFQVVGTFDGLPDVAWRPMGATGVAEPISGRRARARGGITRDAIAVPAGLPDELDSAARLGVRVDTFLAAVARQDPDAADGHAELRADLLAWVQRHGSPHRHTGLARLVAQRVVALERFRAAFTTQGRLIPGLEAAPTIERRYQGELNLLAAADWLFRQRGGQLSVRELAAWWREAGGVQLSDEEYVSLLVDGGWCLDGRSERAWDQLVPAEVYLTGNLWPKLDRAEARAALGDQRATDQARRLRDAIGWRSGPEIAKDATPADSWLPLDLLGAWAEVETGKPQHLSLERRDGLLGVVAYAYGELVNTDKGRTRGLPRDFLSLVGWANYDKGLWNPEREEIKDPETGAKSREPIDQARAKQEAGWIKSFRAWLGESADWMDRLEVEYNRRVRGYVEPTYSADPLALARWNADVVLKDHQLRGVRRLVANRMGLLAFDVGLGKTYTGLATIAAARQQGWAKRPVVLVPNSIVWKWYRDFERCLPDYKVLVIGSRRRVAERGARKGRVIAEPDTPAERAEKWTRFQAGEADAVILAYSALANTKVDAGLVERFVGGATSLRRSIAMAMEAKDEEAANRAPAKKVSERKQADMEERIRAWVGDMLSPAKGQVYDPGIDWHQIGVDLLVVDEAQNFKNLFANPRDAAEKKDTKRSWQLNFRCASVREHTGGAGVVLLSATPAKNDAVELYSAMHYLRPDVWDQVGIDNHVSFLMRFGDYEARSVPDPGGQKLVARSVLVRFKNLAELRDVLFRWSEFKVAEEVGIKLPETVRRAHFVPPSGAQLSVLSELYQQLADIEEKLLKTKGESEDSARIRRILIEKKRGLALRIYLTYLHPELPGIGDNEAAITRLDPHDGPKLVRCVEQILETAERACSADGEYCLNCGHIVFVDNVAVHYWVRDLLIEAGIPRDRIAILNAKEAADIEYRQQVVEAFNGVGHPGDEEYTPPRVDIVIANAVAYEGMDLQRRTCAIHHLDVPWEPATLQQRNGRGVRQGNTFDRVTLHYYFVEGSNENWRVDRIERKRGWMASVVAAQARATNTTLEVDTEDAGAEQLSLVHAPPEARERILRARREAEAQRKTEAEKRAQEQANTELQTINQLFRRAERERDAERAGALRASAEAALDALKAFPSELWPFAWHALARNVREHDLYIPRRGPPLHIGQRFAVDRSLYEAGAKGLRTLGPYERDKKPERGLHLRTVGVATLPIHVADDMDWMEGGRVFDFAPTWPDEYLTKTAESAYYRALRGDLARWPLSDFHRLAPATQEVVWPSIQPQLSQAIAYDYNPGPHPIVLPVRAGRDRIELRTPRRTGELRPEDVLPPTREGWAELQRTGFDSDLTWSQLNQVALFWWARPYPRGTTRDAED